MEQSEMRMPKVKVVGRKYPFYILDDLAKERCETALKDIVDSLSVKLTVDKSNPKMTEIGKWYIRWLCKEKPWEESGEGFQTDIACESEEQANKVYEDLLCVTHISYKKTEKIGTLELADEEYAVFSGRGMVGNTVYLISVWPDVCAAVFTPDLPDYLDSIDGWDAICTIDTYDDDCDDD